MQCPNCGAETGSGNFCQYCGSQITYRMRREQELANRPGCPRCASSNISFKREKKGEIRSRDGTRVFWHTVGYCKDCGFTWYPEGWQPEEFQAQAPQRRRTWLWVLGWIFIFPVPLTILMLRNRNLPAALRYGIIIAAWLVFLLFGMTGNDGDEAARGAADTQAGREIADVLITETPEP